jgi:lysophospholipase L1-like esterase
MAAMRKRRIAALNLLIAIVSVVAALYLCEWVLKLRGAPKNLAPQTSHPANYHEVRDKLEFRFDFRTNSQGLRYPEIPLEKPPGTRRVFVVGDSFTEGWGVEANDRFTDLLERGFGAADGGVLFINGGLSGGGVVQYGRLFFDKGVKYHPDALMICLFANDLAGTPDTGGEGEKRGGAGGSSASRLFRALWPRIDTAIATVRARRDYRKKTTTTDFVGDVTAEAVRRGIPTRRIDAWRESLPPELVEAVNAGRFNVSVLSRGLLYPEYWSDSIDLASTTAQVKWTNMTQVLSEMVDLSRKRKVEVAMVFIPAPVLYDPRSHEPSDPWVRTGTVVKKGWLDEETRIQKKLRAWSEAAGVPFLDLTPVFREAVCSNDNLNYRLDGHWTAEGHAVAAEGIAEWLSAGKVYSFVGAH